ncbi:class I SAM-dependent DNA methyltransferase [Mycoplasma marinum]
MQLFSYIWQEQKAEYASYYAFNPIGEKDEFFTITDIKRMTDLSGSVIELFERWNKFWDKSSVILNNEPFNSLFKPKQSKDLFSPTEEDTKKIFHQFLTILRLYSVSDKSNAFDKMINLFIAKVVDERRGEQNFFVKNKKIFGNRFQFLMGVDDEVSTLKRLNDLYKEGMKQFLGKEIIDYSDDEIHNLLGSSNEKVLKAFEDLRLKKNSAFSFIEVFDDTSFNENAQIVIEIMKLLESIKFSSNSKSQFLGDFFEELLSTSWKQEAGQFFTPMPMVNFIVNSLPIKEKIIEKINKGDEEILPLAIDYACGSGHFIISYMHKVQEIISELSLEDLGSRYNKKINAWIVDPFSWAKDIIFAIEKDYRLVKTTKIATFLNGDGAANIIHGDGINKFNSEEYSGTKLYNSKKENPIFDFVIANPPYAVKGFEANLIKKKITRDHFSLLNDAKSGMIEILFIERTLQLLKEDGIGAIVLPRSILSTDKYESTRDFIFKNFKIISIFESGEASFGGTTTSPIILFLKKKQIENLNYDIRIISSPKFRFGTNNQEKEWLGYKFSSNKHKLGITVSGNNLSENIPKILKKFIVGDFEDKAEIYNNNLGILDRKMRDIIIPNGKTNNSIYLHHKKMMAYHYLVL